MNLSFLTKDPKTTITALIGGIATLLSVFHVINLPPEAQGAIVTVTVILIGLFAKDGSTGFSAVEKTQIISRLKHEGSTQFDPPNAGSTGPDAGSPQPTPSNRTGAAGLILFLILSLGLFPTMYGCAGPGAANQPSFQDQWNKMTPDQKARITLSGIQDQLNQQFDTAKAFVDANPQYKIAWQKEVIPIFDRANQSMKALTQTAMFGTLTPDQVYLKMQPILNELSLKLISMGMKKGELDHGGILSSNGRRGIGPTGY